ncbi:unnamed protein product [Spirodela intermedia]|uniref:Uncharacterized protein n=2 Tax=Spirodela intermedia TaxID=51605 RepID=A0A7I8JV96_SPIIN|nr:unnamed protein product [Spirodela intermedia]CAA6673695.1 unnamed protein product [Spirodela intermedia]CAA7410935.1 unnamed protein product [Spirodela intermedia]
MINPGGEALHAKEVLPQIQSMISSLTGDLRRPAAAAAGDGAGVRIVTLSGTNKGATMDSADAEEEAATALVLDGAGAGAVANSNYQAVNNSVLFDGSCAAENPGVHVVIVEYADGDAAGHEAEAAAVAAEESEVEDVEAEKAVTVRMEEPKGGSGAGREEGQGV